MQAKPSLVLVHGAFADFPRFFMQDLPLLEAQALAVTQRAVAHGISSTKLGQPAWGMPPSWYLISEDDRMINPHEQ